MQIERRQQVTGAYIFYLLRLFFKGFIMFVLLQPSHKRFRKCHMRQTRPTSYITNSVAQRSSVVSKSSNFCKVTACIVDLPNSLTSRFVRQPFVCEGIK